MSECLCGSRWTVLTVKVIWHFAFHFSHIGLYNEVNLLLNIFQTAALLEVCCYLVCACFVAVIFCKHYGLHTVFIFNCVVCPKHF